MSLNLSPRPASLISSCWLPYLLLLVLASLSDALVIHADSGSSDVYLHMPAAFGPQTYAVLNAPLVAAIPADLCEDPPQGSAFRKSIKGAIVMAVRGNCTFVDKTYRAQMLGAKGIVVGNSESGNPRFIRMGFQDEASAHLINIPSVFITRTSYVNLLWFLKDANANANANHSLLASLDERGEITYEGDYSMSRELRLAGIVLLVLPFLWCAVAGLYIIRKVIRNRRLREHRVDRARAMPLVPYKRMSEEEKALAMEDPQQQQQQQMTGPRIVNESCAICLDDFPENLPIKLLPCGHGFHAGCIDPWLNERSELCPICKASILDDRGQPVHIRVDPQPSIISRLIPCVH